MPLLEVNDLHSGYGDVPILHGVSLSIAHSEIVSLVGSNGVGKTTLLRALSRVLKSSGTVHFDGTDVTALTPHDFVRLGIAHVPEGRQLFPNMTVLDNLCLGIRVRCSTREKQERIDRVFALFPQLSERQKQMAGTLSGGEQQMVAIGRGLMLAPRLLMMDEPSLGLAPNMVARIFDAMAEINRLGVAVLLVEQNIVESLKRSHRAYVLEMGRVVLQGEAQALLEDPRMRDVFLGTGGHRNTTHPFSHINTHRGECHDHQE